MFNLVPRTQYFELEILAHLQDRGKTDGWNWSAWGLVDTWAVEFLSRVDCTSAGMGVKARRMGRCEELVRLAGQSTWKLIQQLSVSCLSLSPGTSLLSCPIGQRAHYFSNIKNHVLSDLVGTQEAAGQGLAHQAGMAVAWYYFFVNWGFPWLR